MDGWMDGEEERTRSDNIPKVILGDITGGGRGVGVFSSVSPIKYQVSGGPLTLGQL